MAVFYFEAQHPRVPEGLQLPASGKWPGCLNLHLGNKAMAGIGGLFGGPQAQGRWRPDEALLVGEEWFVGILMCQVTLCWPWDGEKRVNVCESSSMQSRAGRMRGRIFSRCRAEGRRGMLGAGCGVQHEEDQDTP